MQDLDYAAMQHLQYLQEQMVIKLPSAIHLSHFLPLIIILTPPMLFLAWQARRECRERRNLARSWQDKSRCRGRTAVIQQPAVAQCRPNLIRAHKLQAGSHS